jgi:hypothetical protein
MRVFDYLATLLEFERRNGSARVHKFPRATRGLLQLGEIPLDLLTGKKNEIGLDDLFHLLRGWLKLVRIDTRLDDWDNSDLVATDILRDVGRDGGERGYRQVRPCGRERGHGKGEEGDEVFHSDNGLSLSFLAKQARRIFVSD